MMHRRYFVSAYTASPSPRFWSAALEKEYFRALANQPEIIGIEQPFYLDTDKYPLDWLVDTIPSHWSILITSLPMFMAAAKDNPFLGLASQREHDRTLAIKLMEKISDYARELNRAFRRNVVTDIHFHTLPKNEGSTLRGHKTALKKSLLELKAMDWSGVNLNLEHCDAYIPNQVSEKGFLLLEDEIEVLSEIGGYGFVLNWARSAIEGRSVTTPLEHIKMTNAAHLLKGFFFSGCTDDVSSESGAWKDVHMPPKAIISSPYLQPESLMGAKEIRQTFSLLDDDVYLGIKVLDGAREKTLERSIGLTVDTIKALDSIDF